ncbi:hypothetical protein EDD65_10713 [Keratinibaculum paraultunense]|uniref:Outer membrane protein assembly factor BamB n=1 Tax=Keratinibaculum paraultunense TaxID=1278232 RepID=A0A4V2UU13_9FIRM|nr:DUF5711 family protein [Keratinibaculum paraultunense]QQY79783.1 hypothetical protein JL105_00130 [Keratinibaculum paraultunense]TCS88663.1 hypothetical protein EDD65_10713 [Keratinibaculum paraultunense]
MAEKKQEGKTHIGFKIFIILLLGIILFFLNEENQIKFIQFINGNLFANLEPIIEKSISIGEDIEKVFIHGGSIVLWKDNKLIKLDFDGNKQWERDFIFDNTGISVGEKYIYVFEKPSGIIHFLDTNGETAHRVDLETPIVNIVEKDKNVLVHIIKGNKEGISTLDMEGNTIDEFLIGDKNILTYDINEDNFTYIISSLKLDKNEITSEVQVFKKGNELLLEKEIKDEMILYTNFIDKDKVLIMTDGSLYMLKEKEILWEKEFQLIKDIYVDGSKIYILYGNTIETISIDGETQEKISFTEEYKKILPFNGYLIVYGDEYILGLKKEEELFKYKSEEPILKIIEELDKLILIHEDKIELMKFEKKA